MAAPNRCSGLWCKVNHFPRLFRNCEYVNSWFVVKSNSCKFSSEVTPHSNSDLEPSTRSNDELDTTSKIRDVSGLTHNQKIRMRGGITDNQIQAALKNKKLLRRYYLGNKSEFDAPPGILWPSKTELNDIVEYEEEFEPKLHELLAQIEREENESKVNLERRLDLIDKNMAQMPKLIEEYKSRLAAKEQEIQKQLEKRKKLLEEATEMFGYQIDPKDEKFQKMMAEKEVEMKKLAKQKKKADQLKRAQAHLESLAEISIEGEKKESDEGT